MTKSKKEPVEIVMIVDRSGSMESISNDAIGGYNRFLAEQQSVKGAAVLTLVLFDHEYLVLEDRVNIKDAKPLSPATYVPRGNTALNDAIGRAVSALGARSPKKAIVCILTDGQENSSHEFNSIRVKQLIAEAEAKGWKFEYLSASPSGFADGAALGLKTQAFAATSAGTNSAYTSMSVNTRAYRGST